MKNNYRSDAEREFGEWLEENDIPFDYEPYKLKYPVVAYRKYIPDFVPKKTKHILIEFKGWFTASDRKKLLAVKKEHPNLDIRIVFQKDNWMTKKRKMRYSHWAILNGFKYHVGISLPKEWVKELQRA